MSRKIHYTSLKIKHRENKYILHVQIFATIIERNKSTKLQKLKIKKFLYAKLILGNLLIQK